MGSKITIPNFFIGALSATRGVTRRLLQNAPPVKYPVRTAVKCTPATPSALHRSF